MEPAPSLALAMGTMLAATVAAAPPDDPPTVGSKFQGFLVWPWGTDSVVPVRPNSGVVILPKITRPEFL